MTDEYDEIIAVVEELEDIDKPKPLMFGTPMNQRPKTPEEHIAIADALLTKEYYEAKLVVSNGHGFFRDYTLGNPFTTFSVMECLISDTARLTDEDREVYKGLIKDFSAKLGLNVEFTEK